MVRTWQLQEAKNHLSALVNEAQTGDPQIITRRGEEVAIVLSYQKYRSLVASQETLPEFFANSPLAGSDLDLERDTSPPRDAIDL